MAPQFILLVYLAFITLVVPARLSRAGDEAPRLFLTRSERLRETKQRLGNKDEKLQAAWSRLKRDADRALSSGLYSVTDKGLVAPSKDKHDYLSVAPYWWPNPATANGLPYVRRDGQINPERDHSSDRKRLDKMVQGVKATALAYYLTDRADYANHAAKLLRVWFLDSATRMNPRLSYAQAVPGRNLGRGAGIIETHNFPELIDAVGLLAGTSAWKPSEQTALQQWFESYLTWLLNDPQGKAESKADNNHGTWYDVQVASYALFVDKAEIARRVLTNFTSQRIAGQIEPDGRQPRELERTQAWSYAVFNLEALVNAATLAECLDIDLWSYQSDDGRGIRKALDWLIPFATGAEKWRYPQIVNFQPVKLAPLLRRAALRFQEPRYESVLDKLSLTASDERWQLVYPR